MTTTHQSMEAKNKIFEVDDQINFTPLQLRSNERRILIIEDDKDTAVMIKCLIEFYGHTNVCFIANDPYEALNALSNKKFDLVLVDQRLQGMTGSSVLNQMDQFIDKDPLITESRNYETAVPVVFMSAATQQNLENLKLKNFKVLEFVRKDHLQDFLSDNFTN
jgi:CheY-like chemotaxis protein